VCSRIIAVERLPEMVQRTAEIAAKQIAEAKALVRDQLDVAIISVFGKHSKLVRQLMSGAYLGMIVQDQVGAVQGCRGLRPLRGLTTQLAGTGIGFTGLGRRPSLRRRQRSGERELKRKFIRLSLRTFRQATEQLECLAKVGGGLDHCRALDGQMPSLLPILDGLFSHSSAGAMLRHEFRLCR